ncbi:MAG: HD domain-containing protein [Candidatus Promineifilaceae bacterium]|jgi:uncharacterized protein
MNHPDYNAAIEYARSRMEKELKPYLKYHGLEHTFDHVLPAAVRLAEAYELDKDDIDLLKVAAAYHDIGWIVNGYEHEKESVRIAQAVLPSFGFQEESIDQITGIILATHPPQKPHNLLEEIMVDADLDVLGRDDFWKRNADLRFEVSQNGQVFNDREWYLSQLEFLENHSYFTEAARQLRDEGKQAHIEEIETRLEHASSKSFHP